MTDTHHHAETALQHQRGTGQAVINIAPVTTLVDHLRQAIQHKEVGVVVSQLISICSTETDVTGHEIPLAINLIAQGGDDIDAAHSLEQRKEHLMKRISLVQAHSFIAESHDRIRHFAQYIAECPEQYSQLIEDLAYDFATCDGEHLKSGTFQFALLSIRSLLLLSDEDLQRPMRQHAAMHRLIQTILDRVFMAENTFNVVCEPASLVPYSYLILLVCKTGQIERKA